MILLHEFTVAEWEQWRSSKQHTDAKEILDLLLWTLRKYAKSVEPQDVTIRVYKDNHPEYLGVSACRTDWGEGDKEAFARILT